jgi:LemA protein
MNPTSTRTWLTWPIIIIVVLVLGALYIGGTYNSLVKQNEAVDAQWAQVESQYQRRFDLIPNLVASVQGIMKQEQTVFTALADARTRYGSAATPDERAAAASDVESSLSRLLVVMENYPQLKSADTVQSLMAELAGTENRVAVERMRYNEIVQSYNVSVKSFPGSFVASLFGFAPRTMFNAQEGAENAPKVNLYMKARVAALFLASFTFSIPLALAYSSPGTPEGYVTDFAYVLSPETVEVLNGELAAFETSTSNEIAIVTVQNMGGDYIENYTVKLFDEWGIGKKEKDNGVLLLLSVEERKMRIEVGYGLEGALPDSVAQRILNNQMTPLLKEGDYDGAVTAGVHAIEGATQGKYANPNNTSSSGITEEGMGGIFVVGLLLFQFLAAIFARSKSWWAGGVVGLIGGLGIGWYFALTLFLAIPLLVGTMGLGLLFDYLVSRTYQNSRISRTRPPWWIGGSGRGGFGGGGFGGFGGGSSGGGGASGGW